MTATTAGHPPVLRFDSQPDGGPPSVLRPSGHDFAFRPAGGPPQDGPQPLLEGGDRAPGVGRVNLRRKGRHLHRDADRAIACGGAPT